MFEESPELETVEIEVEPGRKVRPWDLLDPRQPKVGKDQRRERMEICEECPEYGKKLPFQCAQCGCLMPGKTMLAMATCPLGKW